MEVQASRVESWDDLHNPGDFMFTHNQAGEICGMIEQCPCGCGAVGALDFGQKRSPRWNWNGDKDKPTLTPSIRRTAGCMWHGYLTDGVFKSC